jgi:hypothetical protein
VLFSKAGADEITRERIAADAVKKLVSAIPHREIKIAWIYLLWQFSLLGGPSERELIKSECTHFTQWMIKECNLGAYININAAPIFTISAEELDRMVAYALPFQPLRSSGDPATDAFFDRWRKWVVIQREKGIEGGDTTDAAAPVLKETVAAGGTSK